MLPYDLVAIDVDGTLIDDAFQIPPKTRAIIREAYEAGVVVALATGRNPSGTVPLLVELGIDGPLIVHNGAFVFRPRSGEALLTFSLGWEGLDRLFRFARQNGLHYDVNTTFHLYVDRVDPAMAALYDAYYAKPIVVDDWREVREPVIKVTMVGAEADVDRLYPEIVRRFPAYRVLRSGETYIDVVHPGANKGAGLRAVAEAYGIPLARTLVIGNYYNDLEMFALAGFSVAMANSPDDVKARADALTASNNEEGVYLALSEHLFGRVPESR
ncbi:MAG: HAD family phosphatase [Hydrogenibacillus sp.]|nr:HAD family phosphatase [Hydrogenibacillus sp.]